ncbi:MAG: C40 family peptidase [Bacteroidales bacterium]|nr:C40 family peptidase [Bacteroidales bacterium]
MDAAELADRIIEEANLYLGTPYRRGGNGPKAFDCTGFTKFIFGKFGYTLGRTVPAQAGDGRELIGNLSDLQKGDLLIFGARGNTRREGHAGIFIGMDSTGTNFSFIHAAVHGGIMVSNLKENYYRQRFLGARRILPDFLPDVPDSAVAAVMERIVDKLVPHKDTLTLSPADRRIILFADGSWAVVDSLGGLSAPTGSDRIVLAEGGSWRAVTPSSVRIPDLKQKTQPEAASKKANASAATAPPPPADGTAVYHTIVSGDTLYGLARKYHTTVQAICNLNGITVKSVLRPGKKLRVK